MLQGNLIYQLGATYPCEENGCVRAGQGDVDISRPPELHTAIDHAILREARREVPRHLFATNLEVATREAGQEKALDPPAGG